jgi:hypothetical protein
VTYLPMSTKAYSPLALSDDMLGQMSRIGSVGDFRRMLGFCRSTGRVECLMDHTEEGVVIIKNWCCVIWAKMVVPKLLMK